MTFFWKDFHKTFYWTQVFQWTEQKPLDHCHVYSSKYWCKEILSNLGNFWVNLFRKTFSFPCRKKQLVVYVTTCCSLYIWNWKTLIFLLNLLVLGFLVLCNTGGPLLYQTWLRHSANSKFGTYMHHHIEKIKYIYIYIYSRFLLSLVF